MNIRPVLCFFVPLAIAGSAVACHRRCAGRHLAWYGIVDHRRGRRLRHAGHGRRVGYEERAGHRYRRIRQPRFANVFRRLFFRDRHQRGERVRRQFRSAGSRLRVAHGDHHARSEVSDRHVEVPLLHDEDQAKRRRSGADRSRHLLSGWRQHHQRHVWIVDVWFGHAEPVEFPEVGFFQRRLHDQPLHGMDQPAARGGLAGAHLQFRQSESADRLDSSHCRADSCAEIQRHLVGYDLGLVHHHGDRFGRRALHPRQRRHRHCVRRGFLASRARQLSRRSDAHRRDGHERRRRAHQHAAADDHHLAERARRTEPELRADIVRLSVGTDGLEGFQIRHRFQKRGLQQPRRVFLWSADVRRSAAHHEHDGSHDRRQSLPLVLLHAGSFRAVRCGPGFGRTRVLGRDAGDRGDHDRHRYRQRFARILHPRSRRCRERTAGQRSGVGGHARFPALRSR